MIGGLTLDQLNRREVEAPDFPDERMHLAQCSICGDHTICEKLFYTAPEGERGIKFSINGGKVSAITFGGNSIGYVEGRL